MHKRRLFPTFFLMSLLFLLAVAFSARTSSALYTTREIEAQLEAKYGIPFQVQELVSKKESEATAHAQQLFYHVTAEGYPNEVFLVKETYIPAHWSRDFFFNLPIRNEVEHTLKDNCLTYAWNTFLVPKFEDMGIHRFSISDQDALDGLELDSGKHTYRMYYHQNAKELADEIYQISQDLNSVPFFCNLPQSDKSSSGHYYRLFFGIYIDHQSDIIPQKEQDSTWLPITIGYHYTKEEITEDLNQELEKLKERNTPAQETNSNAENFPQDMGNGLFIRADGTYMFKGDKVVLVWDEETQHNDVKLWSEETQQWSVYIWNEETQQYDYQTEP